MKRQTHSTAADQAKDQIMTVHEIAKHHNLNPLTIRNLHYRRADCPQPVGRRALYKGTAPVFRLAEFTDYLRELGLIERQLPPGIITLATAAQRIGKPYRYTVYLFANDANFPDTLSTTSWNLNYRNLLFRESDIAAYIELRKTDRKIERLPQRRKIAAQLKPIGTAKSKSKKPPKADTIQKPEQAIKQFLTAPSALRPRVMPGHQAKTVRVRIEGDNGAWS
jgi:predicted DNA-binding transcriptional regulator AlpA